MGAVGLPLCPAQECVCVRILFRSFGPRNPNEPRPPFLAHLEDLTMRARDPFVLFCLAESYSRGDPHVCILTVCALYYKDRLRNREGGEGDRQLPKYPNLPQLSSRMTEFASYASSGLVSSGPRFVENAESRGLSCCDRGGARSVETPARETKTASPWP